MNNLEYKSNKLNTVVFLIVLYALLLLLYLQNGSIISIFLYGLIFFMAIKQPPSIFALLGASNYIALFMGISPIVLSCAEIIGIVLIKSVAYKHFKVRLFKIDKLFVALVLMLVWTFLTGKMQGDMLFFSNVFNFIIIYVAVKLFFSNISCRIDNVLMYFMLGIGVGVVVGIGANWGVPGFVSNHSFRLAVGERSDPNSTGLLMAILTVYLFIKVREVLDDNISKTIVMIVLLIGSIYTLILTQSRGSVLSVVLVLIFYILISQKKVNLKTIIRMSVIIIIAVISINLFDEYFKEILKAFDGFWQRVDGRNATDGARGYLIMQGIESFIKHPILGISLGEFKVNSGHIPHNAFLDYLVTNGIIGAIFFIFVFCWPIIKMAKEFINSRKFSIYCCYIVCIVNILNYSASGEKITLILLLLLTIEYERVKFRTRKIMKGLNAYENYNAWSDE